MDLSIAITEPMHALVNFHNQLNKHIKFSVGALSYVKGKSHRSKSDGLLLPTENEPWNPTRRWKNVDGEVDQALQFIADMGLCRAATAFEEYITGAISELDRGNGGVAAVEADNNLNRLILRVGLNPQSISDEVVQVTFFECLRNCVIHRSGRANAELVELAQSGELVVAVAASARPTAKWKPSIPQITLGRKVAIQPRHAIMASGAFLKLATQIDRSLVNELGPKGMVRMATYWSLFSDNRVATNAKMSAQAVIRFLVEGRYRVDATTVGEIPSILRSIGQWEDAKKAFERLYGAA